MEFDILVLGDHLPQPESGLFSETPRQRHQLWLDMAILGDRSGFRAIHLGEHHDSEYIISSPQIILAGMATQTRRIRLGTGVSLISNLDPVRAAEDFATLDMISGGRAEIGVGSGISQHVFRLFGQDPALRNELSRENLRLLERLWNEDEVTWRGDYRAPLEHFRLEPKTLEKKAIPIFRGTATEAVAAEIGKAGHKLMLLTQVAPFARCRPANEVYREAYRAAGHAPEKMSTSAVAYVYVAEDGDEARRRWTPYGDNYAAMIPREMTRHEMNPNIASHVGLIKSAKHLVDLSGSFVGSPKEVGERIVSAHTELDGFDYLSCVFDVGGLPAEETLASMNLFADKVMPLVRERMSTRR
jgi:alkanesulfonate monooxygenase SsuD/methylene tetrahydromethanopterin reductase-like flavin-dependent oxidoreductase (luciferase family)